MSPLTLLALVAAPGLLQVQGPRLTYNGKDVTLRGVCVGDVVLARDEKRTADYKVISRDWSANCVRIGVAPTSWRKDKRGALKALKTDIKAALDNQMFVLIDWHTIGWPDGYYQIPDWEGTAKDLYDSNFALATDFWKTCAREFGKDGRIGFQLWCEPVLNNRDWETPLGSTWKQLRPWFVKLTNTIRSQGAPNLLLATGNRWAYDLAGIKKNPLPDKNTAYMWHVYGNHDDNDVKKWAEKLDGLDKVAPVVVSEWGFEAGSKEHFKGNETNFGKPFLNFIETRKMHWTAWCWHPTWGPAMLKDDWRTPTPFGQFVKDALNRLNKNAVRP